MRGYPVGPNVVGPFVGYAVFSSAILLAPHLPLLWPNAVEAEGLVTASINPTLLLYWLSAMVLSSATAAWLGRPAALRTALACGALLVAVIGLDCLIGLWRGQQLGTAPILLALALPLAGMSGWVVAGLARPR